MDDQQEGGGLGTAALVETKTMTNAELVQAARTIEQQGVFADLPPPTRQRIEPVYAELISRVENSTDEDDSHFDRN
jgi:hypothetical protein